MHTKHNLTSLLCALALLAATASSHAAALLTLNYSGTFGPTTTLGGSPFGVGTTTPFSFAATFNPAAPVSSVPGYAAFTASSFTILIKGTTYTATTPSALTVLLADPRAFPPPTSLYVVALNTGKPTFVLSSFFTGAAPTFYADTPTPTVFSGFDNQQLDEGFQIALDGVFGGLVINDLVGTSAATLSAVPEPSEWAAISFTVIGLAYAAKRRLTKASPPGAAPNKPPAPVTHATPPRPTGKPVSAHQPYAPADSV